MSELGRIRKVAGIEGAILLVSLNNIILAFQSFVYIHRRKVR